MNRYLLDTNVLLHLVNFSSGHKLIEQRLLHTDPSCIKISAITVWEICRMVEKATYTHKITTKASAKALEVMQLFNVEPLEKRAAGIAGALFGSLESRGNKISERDSMIAGTAMLNDWVMVTDNVSEFGRIPGLTVENWRVPNQP